MKRYNMRTFTEFINEDKGHTDTYPPPEYLVQPHAGETGFFMFKAAFDKMRSKRKKTNNSFSPRIEWRFADEKTS